MNVSVSELALLVLAGLASATYAKSEGSSSLVAAAVGVLVAVVVYLVAR